MKNNALKKLDESIMAKADILGISITELMTGSENEIVDKYKNLVYFVEEYCKARNKIIEQEGINQIPYFDIEFKFIFMRELDISSRRLSCIKAVIYNNENDRTSYVKYFIKTKGINGLYCGLETDGMKMFEGKEEFMNYLDKSVAQDDEYLRELREYNTFEIAAYRNINMPMEYYQSCDRIQFPAFVNSLAHAFSPDKITSNCGGTCSTDFEVMNTINFDGEPLNNITNFPDIGGNSLSRDGKGKLVLPERIDLSSLNLLRYNKNTDERIVLFPNMQQILSRSIYIKLGNNILKGVSPQNINRALYEIISLLEGKAKGISDIKFEPFIRKPTITIDFGNIDTKLLKQIIAERNLQLTCNILTSTGTFKHRSSK